MKSNVFIIADLGFGDSGKGTMTDYLASEVERSLVVRYSGGPQAAHNVIMPDGRHHTFAQFGSGSFHPGSRTFLSRFMLVNPFNLDREAEVLQGKGADRLWQRLSIDNRAPLITPWHIAANRLRELSRGDGRHGSTGQGLGEVMMDLRDDPDKVVYVGDLLTADLRDKLVAVRDHKRSQIGELLPTKPASEIIKQEWRIFDDTTLLDRCLGFYADFIGFAQIVGDDFLANELVKDQRLIFEASQGVLLDSWYGFHPHTTWSNTTPQNALELLGEADYNGPLNKLGIIRAYMTRHGNGPFVTESRKLAARLPEWHNQTSHWAGGFRVGYLDAVALRYAIAACGELDGLAVTCLDRLAEASDWQMATAYQAIDANPIHDLVVGPTTDHNHQEALTALSFMAQPVYQTLDGSDESGYLLAIEQELRLPIAYASFGPTSADKQRFQAPSAVFA